jgi:type II secretory pathway pseudopilin PulG
MDPFGEAADALATAPPNVIFAAIVIALIVTTLGVGLPFATDWLSYRRRAREIDEVRAAAERKIAAYIDGDYPVVDPDADPLVQDAAYERRVRNALAHGVTVSYEHPDGTSSDLSLDPTSVESIEKFLKTIREEDALRGRRGESAAPTR